MKNKKFLIIPLVVATMCLGTQTYSPSSVQAKATFDVFDFEAHRGGRDARPENTLYSYAYAMEMGATTIECDMQFTKDGQIVMSHNPILNHDITKDKNGNYVPKGKYDIRQMTLNEIEQFNVGVMNPKNGEYYDIHGRTQVVHDAKIPTLEELFQLAQQYGDKNIKFNIEAKLYPDPASEGYAHNANMVKFLTKFNSIVKKYHMEDRVVLQSFDWAALKEMKKINPNIATSALWQEQPSWGRDSESLRSFEKEKSPWLAGLDMKDFKGDPIKAAHAIGADIVSPYYMELSKQEVDEAHALGMKVVPWTVNTKKDMEMLLDMGVDGIISDKPWLLREVLEKRHIKLHTPIIKTDSPYHLSPNHIEAKANSHKAGNDAAY